MMSGDDENDSYYHSVKAYEEYNGLKAAYKNEGMSESEIENLLVLDLKENSYFDASVSDYHAGGYYIMQDRDIIRWMIGKQIIRNKEVISMTKNVKSGGCVRNCDSDYLRGFYRLYKLQQ